MDLYLFYNCFSNLNEIFSKDEDELTCTDQKIFNNPLVLYNYHTVHYNQDGGGELAVAAAYGIGKGVSALGSKLSAKYQERKLKKALAAPPPPPPPRPAAPSAPPPQAAAAPAQGAPPPQAAAAPAPGAAPAPQGAAPPAGTDEKQKKISAKAKDAAKAGAKKVGKAASAAAGKAKEKGKAAAKAAGKAALKGALKGMKRDPNAKSDPDALINLLKKFLKIIIGILVVVCTPIVPWILISFYAFKNLGEFIRQNMMNL